MKNATGLPEEFDIEFVKLKEGTHVFQYRLDRTFFEAFENTEVVRAEVTVDAVLEKQVHMVIADLRMKGTVGTHCDRCLEVIDFPVDTTYKVFFSLLGEHSRRSEEGYDTEGSELVIVEHTEHRINYARQVYESVMLGIPMIRNCDDLEDKPCNEQMLNKLNELNSSGDQPNDPRWDKLKDLL